MTAGRGNIMRRIILSLLVVLAPCFTAHAGGTLRIGLNEDPDALDPARGGSFVGRLVFAAVCDKLIDTDPNNQFVPQLATAWAWSADNLALTLTLRDGVIFQDGGRFDAEAARVNLERYREAPESLRKGELRPVAAVEVIDAKTIRLRLSQPYAPLVAALSDRAGMMVSPKGIARLGPRLADELPCAGPFKLTERVAQDRIVVDRFPGYWDAASIKLDRVIYQPIPDTTVRLVNLKAGQLDMIERLGPTDAAAVKADPKLRLIEVPALAYHSLAINLVEGHALRDPILREALEAAIDRGVLNQVVMDGQYIPSNQFEAPGSMYYNASRPVPPRDLARAKALIASSGIASSGIASSGIASSGIASSGIASSGIASSGIRQSGAPHPAFTITVDNQPVEMQVAQVIQSMANEAGFDVKLRAAEANALVAAGRAGDFDVLLVLWSGRVDPDGNVSIWLASDGFLNWGKYHNPTFDEILIGARAVTEVPARQALYRELSDLYLTDRPHIVLYHLKWLWGLSEKVSGFVPTPDGLIRLRGVAVGP
jgi:peptide/nickel transport system substrate-binding protein